MRIADPKKLPRILDAAARLFADRPFAEVRMGDIAAGAGVAKGTLYLHFKDKEALFRAMIAEVSGRRLDEAKARLAPVAGTRERLRVLIGDVVGFSALYPHYLETIHHLDGSPPREKDAALRHRRERLLDLVEGLLRDADASDELVVSHPGRAALALLGMLHRVMISTPRPWPDDLADWITGQFLFGVAKRPEGTGGQSAVGDGSPDPLVLNERGPA